MKTCFHDNTSRALSASKSASKRLGAALVLNFLSLTFLSLIVAATVAPELKAQPASGKRPMTFEDAMKFRTLDGITLSYDGSWLGYVERPDRGDPTVRLQSLRAQPPATQTIERGTRLGFTRDAAWAVVTVAPAFLVAEKAKPDNRPDNALCLIQTASGKRTMLENVSKFALSENTRNGQWLAVLFTKNRKEDKSKDTTKMTGAAASLKAVSDSVKAASKPLQKDSTRANKANTSNTSNTSNAPKDKKPDPGTLLLLRNLTSGEEVFVPFVKDFAFDSLSTALAVTTFDSSARGTCSVRLLADAKTSVLVDSAQRGIYTHPTWHQHSGLLAYCAASVSTTNVIAAASLRLWDAQSPANAAQTLVSTSSTLNNTFASAIPSTSAGASAGASAGWILPSKNTLVWTQDGKRLFFGVKPSEIHRAVTEPELDLSADTLESDLYSPEKILKSTEIDVWKWDDDYTNIHQKKRWETVKDQTYQAFYDIATKSSSLLASRDMPSIALAANPATAPFALGRANAPHRRKITWDGSYEDLYAVSLASSQESVAERIAERIADNVQYDSYISPNGQFILYYQDKHWFLRDIAKKTTRNLTKTIGVAFWDESDDHPAEKPPYGFAGWVVDGSNDAALMLYDKFDVWQFATSTSTPNAAIALNISAGEGRKQTMILRAEALDTAQKFYRSGDFLLLSGRHDEKKYSAFFAASVGASGVRNLFQNTAARFTTPIKAQGSSTLLFRQSAFDRFPDLWLSDTRLTAPSKITNLQQQVEPIAWGSAELVSWRSADGKPLQGILIKPANYERGKRYPMLIYYYEILSETLYNFGQPRFSSAIMPSFFASNGYAVLIPDIVYKDGAPGASALKCVVPAAQKIIAMGIADPKAIGIQGHSWGGYQSLYMITQTPMFKAAVAGAPVANMTSAYGGIRYGSGLARMFQYERSQSRLGATLWERRDLFLNNSPLFFADRITTPLLMMFGDEDDAVPFTQGIEMYLAMRRLNKEAHLLQYRKEPHNPRKFANRYDYARKMKDFFDYHLKGAAPADWLKASVPYQGR
jgi:dienelactone hydrolase